MSSKNKKVFAEGYSFKKLFLIFVIGSIFGALYEQIVNLITTYLQTGNLVWELRRGVIYGPFSPIYGAGAVLLVYFLSKPNYSNLKTFIFGALGGGAFEYLISFLQETFLGTVSWDYTNEFLNLNGRISILYSFVWGILALLLINQIHPFIEKTIRNFSLKIPHIMQLLLLYICTFLYIADTIYSAINYLI